MSARNYIQQLAELPTPFYFYDMELLNRTLNKATEASSRYGYKIHYALKSNFDPRIVEAVRRAGMGMDCVSGNEVRMAVENGFAASEIVFAGVGKTDREIEYALGHKTPIALIQGYSEGLLENVNTDEESRKFYAEVILDETNKMDKLVKQLLELMKLEYGKREFNDKEFNIIEVEKEVIRKSKVMLEENKIEVKIDTLEPIQVFADDFYIEQVITNYITNAIKNAKEINNCKLIKISNKIKKEEGKVRVTVFNSGKNIKDEDLERIWNRFYKADESRNRSDGGTGIGLAFVKAIMNNYQNKYGINNVDDGVEFYFELDLTK